MKRVAPHLRRHGLAIVVAAGLLAYLAMSLWRLRWPGLQYDEMLFANAALGGIDTTFIYYSIGRLPLFLMSYIGGLKAWLYYPIFHLFGVSVESVRVPMIIVSASGLAIFARLSDRVAGTRAAIFAFLLLTSNAAYLWAARVDHGPVVLGAFFEIVAAAAFFAGAPWVVALACVLGLFQKVVFFFWAAAFFPAAFLLYPERRRHALAAVAASGAYLAAWCALLGPPEKDVTAYGSLAYRFTNFGAQLSGLLDGSSFYRTLLLPAPWELPAAIAAALVVAGGLWRLRGRDARCLRLLALQFAGSLAITFLVGPVKSYWHFYGLLPWIYLAVAISLAAWGRAGFALFCAFLLVNLHGQARSAMAVGERPGSARYTMAIYPLIDYCRSLPGQVCASVSWGTHTQLEAFTWKGRISRPLEKNADPDPRFVYVDYDGLVNVSHDESNEFFQRMEIKGWTPELIHRIDDDGRGMFVVYRFRR